MRYQYCVYCRQQVIDVYQLCAGCWSSLGEQIRWDIGQIPVARVVYYGESSGLEVRYILDYDQLAKYLVVRLKYHDGFWTVPILAGLLCPAMRKTVVMGVGVYGVVAVPMHSKRLYKRGYNQAAILAIYIAKKLGMQFYARGLTRIKEGKQQQGLSRLQRRYNVQQAFRACKGLPRALILIDDVVTTGATMQSCVRALEAQGYMNIQCWAICAALSEVSS